jgi:hypothetical protein
VEILSLHQLVVTQQAMDATQQVVVQVVLEMDLHQLQMEQVLTVQQVLMELLFPLSLAQLTAVAVAVAIAIPRPHH